MSVSLDGFGFCCLSHPRLENLLGYWRVIFVIKPNEERDAMMSLDTPYKSVLVRHVM